MKKSLPRRDVEVGMVLTPPQKSFDRAGTLLASKILRS